MESGLEQIAFEQIKEDYWYGWYGQFNVVMMKSCGWVNGTKLCKDGGKQLKHWFENSSTRKLMNYLQTQLGQQSHANTQGFPNTLGDTSAGIPTEVSKYIQTENKSDQDRLISGTYIHPDLVPSLASWISPEFALKACRIINDYITHEYQEKLANEELARQHAEQKTGELRKDMCKWASTHSFAILKLNYCANPNTYYAIRRLREDLDGVIRKKSKKYTGAKVIFEQRSIPNPINIYKRMKDAWLIRARGNLFWTHLYEQQLITEIRRLIGEVTPIDVKP